MKKILFVPFDLLAHYLRCIEIAKNLVASNLEIVFLNSGKYNDFVISNGFRITKNPCLAYEKVIESAGKFDFSWINEKSVRKAVDFFINVIEDEKPDMVISDTYPGISISCSFLKIKHISIVNAYATNNYALFRDVPHNHRANRFRKYLTQEKWDRIVRTVEEITLKRVHTPFKKIRKNLSIDLKENLFDEFTSELNLIVDDPEIFPIKIKDNSYVQLGPVLYACRKIDNTLINFLNKNSSKPCIFISTGSSGKNIIPNIIKPEELQDFNLIVTGSNEEYENKNVIYKNFVNFDIIADKIDLVICHGGNGTMYQSLNAGKKIIAVPSIFEQEWNIQRFSALNLCKVFYPEENPQKLIKLIFESFKEKSIATYKSKYKKVPAKYGDVIIEYLSK